MKYSIYNIETILDDYSIAIYNSVTNALVVVSKNELCNIKNGKINEEESNQLKKCGILVENEEDEYKRIEYLNFLNRGKGQDFYRILTTMDCNANCIYCYEKKNKHFMSQDIADNVINFIEARTKKEDSFRIEWFGGEPLLNHGVISYISDKLKNDGFSAFIGNITTNGILFDDDLVLDAKTLWNIKKVQITIDGVEDKYLSIKRIEGKDVFRRLCDNIEKLAFNEIFVTIRMNYDGRKQDFRELLAFFCERFGYNEYISYYFYPVFVKGMSVDRTVAKEIIDLNEIIINTGLSSIDRVYNMSFRAGRCAATRSNSYTIGVDGSLYNCTHTMESEGSISSIHDYSGIEPKRIAFSHYLFSNECKICRLLPICGGGCRASELKLDSLNQCNVYKDAFDLYIKQRVKLKEDRK